MSEELSHLRPAHVVAYWRQRRADLVQEIATIDRELAEVAAMLTSPRSEVPVDQPAPLGTTREGGATPPTVRPMRAQKTFDGVCACDTAFVGKTPKRKFCDACLGLRARDRVLKWRADRRRGQAPAETVQ